MDARHTLAAAGALALLLAVGPAALGPGARAKDASPGGAPARAPTDSASIAGPPGSRGFHSRSVGATSGLCQTTR